MSVMSFRGVRRLFGRGDEVLRGVDLAVQPGEVVALLGRNGAGKTTLLRIAMGMLDPHGGEARLFGLDPFREPVAVRRRVGYVAEDQALPIYLRVEQVLALHRSLFPTWDEQLAGQLRERFAIDPRAAIGKLSKGTARQVALLCAVAHRPELLILDEPAGGLDPVARREFLETSIATLGEGGTSILFSSHQLEDVERLAGRVAFLSGGTIVFDHPVDEVREGHSLAVLPIGSGIAPAELRHLDGWIGTRESGTGLHVVFRRSPGQVADLLASRGVHDSAVRPLTLEDLFFEITASRP